MADGKITARLKELGEQAAQQDFKRRQDQAIPQPTSWNWMQDYFSQHPFRALVTGLAMGTLLAIIFRLGNTGHES
jgi:hypothetical protein